MRKMAAGLQFVVLAVAVALGGGAQPTAHSDPILVDSCKAPLSAKGQPIRVALDLVPQRLRKENTVYSLVQLSTPGIRLKGCYGRIPYVLIGTPVARVPVRSGQYLEITTGFNSSGIWVPTYIYNVSTCDATFSGAKNDVNLYKCGFPVTMKITIENSSGYVWKYPYAKIHENTDCTENENDPQAKKWPTVPGFPQGLSNEFQINQITANLCHRVKFLFEAVSGKPDKFDPLLINHS